jgi:hypothetical protein
MYLFAAVVETLRKNHVAAGASRGVRTGASGSEGRINLEACVALINLVWANHVVNKRRAKAAGAASALQELLAGRGHNEDAKMKAKQALALVA